MIPNYPQEWTHPTDERPETAGEELSAASEAFLLSEKTQKKELQLRGKKAQESEVLFN